MQHQLVSVHITHSAQLQAAGPVQVQAGYSATAAGRALRLLSKAASGDGTAAATRLLPAAVSAALRGIMWPTTQATPVLVDP